MRKRTKRMVLAYLLGVLSTLIVNRWVGLEADVHNQMMHTRYIESFLEQMTGGR